MVQEYVNKRFGAGSAGRLVTGCSHFWFLCPFSDSFGPPYGINTKSIKINGFIYKQNIKMYRKWLGMVGKWLGCVQPMCSKPGCSWQGFFSFSKVGPFSQKVVFVFIRKPPFIMKKALLHYSDILQDFLLYIGTPKEHMMQTVQYDGVIGLEGSTWMDQNGHVSTQGQAFGGRRVQITKIWYSPTLST